MIKKSHTIAIVDAGGRGAALVDKYSQSPYVDKILAIPGNDFMHVTSQKQVILYPNLKTTSPEIVDICHQEGVSLVDVLQDNAIAVGLADQLKEKGIDVVGPTKHAGEIEWNKAYAREFMVRHNIPHPSFAILHSVKEGLAYLKEHENQPWFVKASGLAEGKGALPAKDNTEAIKRIYELQKFGDASSTYLLEQWLQGKNGEPAEEFSAFAVSDGEHFKILGYAQDHKRAFDNDEGENTGGMGCSTPPLVIDDNITGQVEDIFTKTVKGLKEEGRPYKGILYLGGILVEKQGKQHVYVIEFNARWGDPEAQVLVPSMQNDFFQLSKAITNGTIDTLLIQTDGKVRVVIAGVAKGYPSNYSQVKGKIIYGLEEAMKTPGVTVYGAGIKRLSNTWVVNGGRVFYVIGQGNDIIEARDTAYTAMSKIYIEGDNLHYRKDIGGRDVKRLRTTRVVYERT